MWQIEASAKEKGNSFMVMIAAAFYVKMESLLMQTADICCCFFGLFGPHQCSVVPRVNQQLLADQTPASK